MSFTGEDGIDNGAELDLERRNALVELTIDSPRPQILPSGEIVATFTMPPAQARAVAHEILRLADGQGS